MHRYTGIMLNPESRRDSISARWRGYAAVRGGSWKTMESTGRRRASRKEKHTGPGRPIVGPRLCRLLHKERRLALRQDQQLPLAMSRVVRGIFLADGNAPDRSCRALNSGVCRELPIAAVAGSRLHVDRGICAGMRGTVRCPKRKHREQQPEEGGQFTQAQLLFVSPIVAEEGPTPREILV